MALAGRTPPEPVAALVDPSSVARHQVVLAWVALARATATTPTAGRAEALPTRKTTPMTPIPRRTRPRTAPLPRNAALNDNRRSKAAKR